MKDVIEYARDASSAVKYYISLKGVDDTACEIYDFIQHIDNLDDSEKSKLDTFIANNVVDVLHLGNITYVSDSGEDALILALSNIKPYIVCDPKTANHNFYEARGNELSVVKKRETAKIIKRTYPKKAA